MASKDGIYELSCGSNMSNISANVSSNTTLCRALRWKTDALHPDGGRFLLHSFGMLEPTVPRFRAMGLEFKVSCQLYGTLMKRTLKGILNWRTAHISLRTVSKTVDEGTQTQACVLSSNLWSICTVESRSPCWSPYAMAYFATLLSTSYDKGCALCFRPLISLVLKTAKFR